jgi:hypothetical protein
LLSFQLKQLLFISSEKDVALPLKVEVDPVVENPASGFDVREVLLGDPSIKHLLHLGFVVALIHVKCLVFVVSEIPLEFRLIAFDHFRSLGSVLSLRLTMLHVCKTCDLRSSPLFLLADVVPFFNLPFQIISKAFLLLLSFDLLPFVGVDVAGQH